jgi:hypothetical protein
MMVIFLVIAAVCIVGLFIYMYRIANPKPVESSGKSNLLNFISSSSGGTIVARAPVVYYRIPGENSKKVQLQHTKTLIGRKEGCDIVLDHPSISDEHAEIYLAIKRKKRVFVLKNLSKVNPVVWTKSDQSTGAAIRKDVTRHIILSSEEQNWFLLGDVKMMIEVPAVTPEEVYNLGDSSKMGAEQARHEQVQVEQVRYEQVQPEQARYEQVQPEQARYEQVRAEQAQYEQENPPHRGLHGRKRPDGSSTVL